MQEKLPKPQSQCQRCATCCAKGGPALHLEDNEYLESGKIPLKNLFTIREGEPAYDNIQRRVAPAATDIIKIKGAARNDATCLFLDQGQVACTIYDHRPMECRLLSCWDTRALVDVYDKRRITRNDLLSRFPALIDLVAEHQTRCDYRRMGQLAARVRQGEDAGQATESLLELIRYDQSLRLLTVERSRLDSDLLEFLFGRPAYMTIRYFRLRLSQKGETLALEPCL